MSSKAFNTYSCSLGQGIFTNVSIKLFDLKFLNYKQ